MPAPSQMLVKFAPDASEVEQAARLQDVGARKLETLAVYEDGTWVLAEVGHGVLSCAAPAAAAAGLHIAADHCTCLGR